MADTAWAKFENDLNAMTDAEVDSVTKDEQRNLDQAEDWLEAVAAWSAAGRPRIMKPRDAEGEKTC